MGWFKVKREEEGGLQGGCASPEKLAGAPISGHQFLERKSRRLRVFVYSF
ncbi:hypothetical protein HanXRQr2_Chr16g0734691 [Helianthus annuus]|uniref:Uncharacterized protein n=1 Tax=Helianthus annuus TaxID=4232 RepID=A0A9K3GXQ2_HELAN|nr:hypothetical protein HanXRQr2_Chr16g0734691 [Helianthus annuus]